MWKKKLINFVVPWTVHKMINFQDTMFSVDMNSYIICECICARLWQPKKFISYTRRHRKNEKHTRRNIISQLDAIHLFIFFLHISISLTWRTEPKRKHVNVINVLRVEWARKETIYMAQKCRWDETPQINELHHKNFFVPSDFLPLQPTVFFLLFRYGIFWWSG